MEAQSIEQVTRLAIRAVARLVAKSPLELDRLLQSICALHQPQLLASQIFQPTSPTLAQQRGDRQVIRARKKFPT